MSDGPPPDRDAPRPQYAKGAILRGKYRIERVLGEGGMGVVLLATHLKLDQRVALKVLRPSARDRHQLVARFAREARAAAKLRNEHVVRVVDVDETDDGDPFLVMEYLVGSDLESRIAREGPLAPARAVDLVLQACEGIAEAHAVGIVHRDIKPANLFVARTGDGAESVKVLDFGIAKAASDDDLALTATNGTVGSPLYMSPEQLKGTREIDARTDIWALGVVLYQLVSGQLPFEATSATGLAALIASEPPRSLRELRPELPETFVEVVERCLEKDPARRFSSVVALAEALTSAVPLEAKSSERVRRVARAAAAKNPSLAETMLDPASDPLAAASAVPTRVTAALSEEEAPGAPEARDHATDYASEVARSTATSPRARSALVVGSVLAVAAIVLVVRETRSPATARTPATASVPSGAIAPVAEPRATATETASAPSAATAVAADAGVTPPATTSTARATTAPAPRPRPSAAAAASPPSTPSVRPAASKNPLDIDIQ